MTDETGKVENCSFINISTDYGYIFYTWYSSIINSKFYNCSGCNATICVQRGNVANCSFFNCKSLYHGREGCIILLDKSNIVGSNFTDCYSAVRIYIDGTVDKCNFNNCHNISIIVHGIGNSVINNSCFTNSDDGAIKIYSQDNKISNSKFVNCSSADYGAAI